ncbi:MAG: FkbM family methyltransferase [Candidatus Peregrinibacteria bacterium Gr01-1014_25]|nr:MAG: FkbM family methyltransferase [Candidatus Peregrinibacteria bacterium Gr01-1014_25]
MSTPTITLLWRLLTTVRNWPVYFLNRFGWMEKRSEVRFHLWNGMTIIGRPFSVDRAIINEEWLDRCYDPNALGLSWDWRSCRTIVDIGAHIGTFTLFAAAHAPGARIVAVEPEPSNAQLVRRNIGVNRLGGRVELVEAALGAADGSATLHVTFARSGSGGHSLIRYEEASTSVTVPVVCLASLFQRHGIDVCDVLKIDCEGAEYDALYATPPDILRHVGGVRRHGG